MHTNQPEEAISRIQRRVKYNLINQFVRNSVTTTSGGSKNRVNYKNRKLRMKLRRG